jgi:hypothetical protein
MLCIYRFVINNIALYQSGPKITKLKLETRLKSQASDWLKWRPGLVSNLSFMILGPGRSSRKVAAYLKESTSSSLIVKIQHPSQTEVVRLSTVQLECSLTPTGEGLDILRVKTHQTTSKDGRGLEVAVIL